MIPRQYLNCGIDHLLGGLLLFMQEEGRAYIKWSRNMKREEMMQYIIGKMEKLNDKTLATIMDIIRLLTK